MKTNTINYVRALTRSRDIPIVSFGRIINTTAFILLLVFSIVMGLLLGITGCKKDNTATASYKQISLVSDTAGFGAGRIDPQLVNAWGIAINPNNGAFWIADNGTGLSSVYNSSGTQLLPAVTLPSPGSATDGAASGAIYNSTTDFGGNPFIYCTEDGTILTWKSGSTFNISADNSGSNAVFKGIALANDGTGNFLFVADFHNNLVDVFDKNFAPVTGRAFTDPSPLTGYAPFNIQVINGQLYVVYAVQDGMQHDDVRGAGNGYINVFNYDGTFVRRFTTHGTLNSPWGILPAPSGFGQTSGAVLVGNFGDGTINVFDSNGNFLSQLKDNTGKVIFISGLWGIASLSGSNNLFFTAGPSGESHGLFGYLQKN